MKKVILKCYIYVQYMQWRLQDFFVGGAGGLNSSEGVLNN